MLVFHSSKFIVEKPDIAHSRDYLDFGRGFYVTTILDQAVKYAERFKRRSKDAWLNYYEFNYNPSEWKVLEFKSYDEVWLDFVADCRSGNTYNDYDIVIGGIANDKVFRTVDLYFSGDMTKDEALKRLVFENPNNQICIRNQKLLDKCLTFIKCEKYESR